MSQPTPRKVSADERLLALVHALVDPRLRLTRRDIRASVPGYDQAEDAAFERMFERDKETLREWRLPMLVSGEAHDAVYRIDLEAWQPQDVLFTAAELAVVGLAAQAWNASHQQHAATSDLATSARLATTKLAGRGASVADPVPDDLTIRLRAPGPAYLPLMEAADQRRRVSFAYLSASSGTEATRHLEPWTVVRSGDAWYAVGHDTDRGAPRAFRLSRVRGNVRAHGPDGAFDVPDLDAAALRSLVRPVAGPTASAVVAVLPGRAHDLRSRAVRREPSGATAGPLADRELLTLPELELDPLADELAGLGDGALVVSPAELRTAVVERLRATAALTGEWPR